MIDRVKERLVGAQHSGDGVSIAITEVRVREPRCSLRQALGNLNGLHALLV